MNVWSNKHLLFLFRHGSGALCDGSEPVSNFSFGVFDDKRTFIRCGCCGACATAPLYPAQSWLPETAQGFGHRPAGGEAETEKERWMSSHLLNNFTKDFQFCIDLFSCNHKTFCFWIALFLCLFFLFPFKKTRLNARFRFRWELTYTWFASPGCPLPR